MKNRFGNGGNMNYRIPKPDIEFHPPVYQCRRATKPFVLDGNVEKEFWQDAEFTELFADIEGEKMPNPRFNTRAKMLWDDENLYVGAILEGDEIWGHQTERDCVIFWDNDFEIFIDPDSDTHQYYEFEMNAKNTVWDLLLTKTYRDGGKPVNGFDMHGLRTAVHIDGELNNPAADNRRWMVEVVIPFAAVNECAQEPRNPRKGEYYRVNFSRVQWKVDVVDGQYKKRTDENGKVLPEDNWVWAPTGVINIHYPELWGFVFFTEGDETYEIPEIEREKWQLRKMYYNVNAYYDENGHFPASLEEVVEEGSYTVVPSYVPAKHTFEISCDCADGEHELAIMGDGRVYVYNK